MTAPSKASLARHGAPPSYAPSEFFVLRTPFLPHDVLRGWSEGLQAPGVLTAGGDLDAALAVDRERLRAGLRVALHDPAVREALFIASPSLAERLALWEREPGGERGVDVERPLVRYFERMATRPTPFGLFAGCSVGRVGPATALVLAGRAAYRRHTRLDMHYLTALGEALACAPELLPDLRVHPNSSLYRTGGRIRHVEARTAPATRERTYHLVSTEPTDYLDATLERARDGARVADLAAALAVGEVSREEAGEYLAALVAAQLLVPDLEPAVTGPEPVHELVTTLRELPGAASHMERLEGAREAIAAIDADGPGVAPERYRAVAGTLEGLPCEAELARLFQVDLVKPAPEAVLGEAVVAEIARGVEILRRMARPAADGALTQFRDAFARRYEAREVPLVEALDEETGVGFGAHDGVEGETSPLLDGLDLQPHDSRRADGASFGPREALLLGHLTDALARGATEIALDEQDLRALERSDAPPLPDAFAAIATLAAPSDAALAAGDFRVWLHGASGPSGAVLLGRFCHGDVALHEAVAEHLRAEEALRPDAVFAEIVHLPQGRVGNVILRPVVRRHEIAYMGRSGAPAEARIDVGDLRVSVVGDRVVLRSARLVREVVPRLTSAHNFALGDLGVYRFLCALQHQGTTGAHWTWGALDAAPFLPRVTCGRLVLALARWHLGRRDVETLGTARGDGIYRAAQELRARLRLPRQVLLADGDNTLLIDFDNVLSVEAAAHVLRGREVVVLSEVFPGADELCARGPEGRFVHELVVPFVRRELAGAVPGPVRAPRSAVRAGAIARSFPPGSEWLFAKFYAGVAVADDVLRSVVRPVVDAALASGAADGWFFIRYGDPEWHVRLRLHGDPARLCGEVLPALHAAAAPLMGRGQIWRIDLGTYEREVERYGGPAGVLLAERLFQADSECALTIVEGLDGDAGADARWRLALRGMDALLDDLDLALDVRCRLLASTRDAFAREFAATSTLDRGLDQRYRVERASLETLLDPRYEDEDPLAPGLRALRERSAALAPVVATLRAADAKGDLAVPLAALAASYLHMVANRLLRSAARAQERVLYDFLARLYTSRMARARGAGQRKDNR